MDEDMFIDVPAVKKELAELRAENARLRQQTAQQEEAARVASQARQLLDAAGLTWDDPRLAEVKALGPTQEGLLALSSRVIELAAQARDAAQAAGTSQSARPTATLEQLKARWQVLRGTGHESPQYRKFLDDMRNAGLTLEDVA